MIVNVNGNILNSDCDIICHQVNTQGHMGKGLAKQIKEQYRDNYDKYVELCEKMPSYRLLGGVFFYPADKHRIIANMFAQERYGNDKKYTDYNAFIKCVETVYDTATKKGLSVAFPYGIGCGNGGGDWKVIMQILTQYFGSDDIVCKIYKI